MTTAETVAHVLLVAEAGSVHDGSLGNAMRLATTAKELGADIVKFQTHLAEAETVQDAPMPSYFTGESRYAYFERTAFDVQQWQQLKDECDELGIEFMSSPFSTEAVALLELSGVARYKIPSGEVTNIPLLNEIGQTGKPVLLSSGMGSWKELDEAVSTLLRFHDKITVLQCTSEYPCPYERVGLNVMQEMRERYQLPVGLSDHTLTPYASIAAVMLGASVIEKHLTFSRRMYGSDAPHSLEPEEFRELVTGIRAVETLLASPVDKDSEATRLRDLKHVFEKSIVARVDIPAGTSLTPEHLALKKPGGGLAPRRYEELVGRRTARSITKDSMLREEDLDA